MKMNSTKPISSASPSRGAENFPPPLMRFLKTNVGSRSRGRSRASPIFILRKNLKNNTKNTNNIEPQQEPSSPKVTCIGQVRVRKSTKDQTRCLFSTRRRKRKKSEDSSKIKANSRYQEQTLESQETEEEEVEEIEQQKVRVFASSPPKNALLLTRSRSAPYRSSSLANRFWGSSEEEPKTEEQHINNEKFEEPKSISDPSFSNSSSEPRADQESEEKPNLGNKFEEKEEGKFEEKEGLKTEEFGETVRPLTLTRCKSEPARVSERIVPELSSWKKRRLGLCSPLVVE
ncbi:hypothetical protein RJ641_028218 [Dillenia turbinata]|uniref:Uncharacterized protein n=1 Tax=Dillenia turbinata TaxID=194707 RepID=A0AAN8ZM32_9MAGN